MIAFTSDFVPKLIYYYDNNSMSGYVNSSLSYFDSSNLHPSHSEHPNATMCRFLLKIKGKLIILRYRGYRKPPCSLGFSGDCSDGSGLPLSDEFWRIFAYRLLFVVVFEVRFFVSKNLSIEASIVLWVTVGIVYKCSEN